MVLEKIAELLAQHTGCSAADVKKETTFDSLGIDSLDTVEMVMELEEQLGIELELEQKVETVGELVDLIEAKMD